MSTTTSPLNSAALRILQQASVQPPSKDETPPVGSAILAAANGVAIPSVSGPQSQAKAKISDALMEGPVDIQELKFHLFRRAGEAFGVNMDDYKDARDFASAIRKVVTELRSSPGGMAALAKVEKDLGLNELHISIDEPVDAMYSPDGEGGKKLDAALRGKTGEDAKDAAAKAVLNAVQTDETGLYSV